MSLTFTLLLECMIIPNRTRKEIDNASSVVYHEYSHTVRTCHGVDEKCARPGAAPPLI
jgi:hypothetical protein